MTEYQEVTRTEWKKSLLIIAVMVVIISASAFFMLPDYILGWIALVIVCVFAIIVLVAREEKNVTFRCPKCQHTFTISGFKSALSPHGVTKEDGKWLEWKYLECPMCHEKSKMVPLRK
jgi:hypothetical protein